MTLKRMDNVLVVVDDLEAAKAFFVELGMKTSTVCVSSAGLRALLLGWRRSLGKVFRDGDFRIKG